MKNFPIPWYNAQTLTVGGHIPIHQLPPGQTPEAVVTWTTFIEVQPVLMLL